MSVLAIDDFNRANNADLGSAWDVVPSDGSFKIVSNAAEPTSRTADAAESYNGVAAPNDQYSQAAVTLAEASAEPGTGIGVGVRMSAAAQTYYRFFLGDNTVGNSNAWVLGKALAGTFSTLASGSVSHRATATVYLEMQGNVLVAKIDGVTVATVDETGNSPIASGRFGISHSSNTTTGIFLDNWEGGDFAAAAAKVPHQPWSQRAPVLAG